MWLFSFSYWITSKYYQWLFPGFVWGFFSLLAGLGGFFRVWFGVFFGFGLVWVCFFFFSPGHSCWQETDYSWVKGRNAVGQIILIYTMADCQFAIKTYEFVWIFPNSNSMKAELHVGHCYSKLSSGCKWYNFGSSACNSVEIQRNEIKAPAKLRF